MKKYLKYVIITFLIGILMFFNQSKRYLKNDQDVMAIWVPRFDFKSSYDVERIIKNCSDIGFTDIFFQIRGQGTTYFKSDIEPWSYELFNSNSSYLDPGWDPLETAIYFSKIYNIKIHAYMNVLPGWKGLDEPPINNGHLWTNHKEFFMVDSFGDIMMPTKGWYTFLNPSHPSVKLHLESITKEIMKYDVDGLHLDYIRYPYDYYDVADQIYTDASDEELKRRSDFSYDPYSLDELNRLYGKEYSKRDMREYKINTITRLVDIITKDFKKNTNIITSASVLANPSSGKFYAAQDSINWIDSSLLDWIVQMNYGTTSFNRNLRIFKNKLGKKAFNNNAVIGIYAKNNIDDIKKQLYRIKRLNPKGTALFSYGLLFNDHQINEKGKIVELFISNNL